MEKRYGLPTAICMVVGIVIGSGVFFKAEKVLQATKGNMPLGILAWGIVGAIMIICSYVFATMATRYEKVSGLVDYAEATVGRRYAYYVGWFMAVLYTPCLVSALAWISARYFCVLLGWDITGGPCMAIACFFLCMSFAVNALSPWLAGRFQVATTVIKIPAPTGGYVHIGDGLVLLCGWILGPWWGGAAAGIGSMLVDLLGGYMSFVPGTLIIKFLDAMAAALIVKALGRKTYSYVVGGLAGEAIMVAGYFVYEALALQLGMGAAAGVLANVGQGAVGLVIALVLMALLKGSKALDKLAVQW